MTQKQIVCVPKLLPITVVQVNMIFASTSREPTFRMSAVDDALCLKTENDSLRVCACGSLHILTGQQFVGSVDGLEFASAFGILVRVIFGGQTIVAATHCRWVLPAQICAILK